MKFLPGHRQHQLLPVRSKLFVLFVIMARITIDCEAWSFFSDKPVLRSIHTIRTHFVGDEPCTRGVHHVFGQSWYVPDKEDPQDSNTESKSVHSHPTRQVWELNWI